MLKTHKKSNLDVTAQIELPTFKCVYELNVRKKREREDAPRREPECVGVGLIGRPKSVVHISNHAGSAQLVRFVGN